MKTLSLTLVLAFVALGTAGAVAVPAATSADASNGIVDCVRYFLYQTVTGNPYEPCAVQAETAAAEQVDPKKAAACVAYFVDQIVNERPILPCEVSYAAVAAESDFVDCVKEQAKQILAGVTPMPCAVEADAAQQVDPKKVVDCTKYVVGQIATGRPVLPCDVSFGASAGPDPTRVVECTREFVRNYLQGTPQPCAL